MALLLPLTLPSLRRLVMWLKVLLRHTSGQLEACFRLILSLARNTSTHFRIIRDSNAPRGAFASSLAPPSMPDAMTLGPTPAANNDPGNLAIPASTDQPANATRHASSGHDQGGHEHAVPGANAYTSGFFDCAEVQDENHLSNLQLRPTLASFIQNERYDGCSRQLPKTYSYSALPGVPDFSEYESRTLCTLTR
jgi:hypothetical protein